VSDTEGKIIEFLAEKAKDAWKDEHPYLLSFAGPDMAKASIDYRAILDGERLKAFVERTAGKDTYQIVKHPHQKAKVAIVPSDADFSFKDIDQEIGSSRSAHRRVGERGATLLNFLDVLSELPAEDLDGVVIPARALVKLAKKR
jgi:hypothetical protein